MSLSEKDSKKILDAVKICLNRMIKEEDEKENKKRKDLKRKIEKNIQVPVKDKKRKM